MPENHDAENVLGTIGTVLWSGQILPQIWKSYHDKSTLGLSGLLMFIWATSAIFLGVYNIVQDINIPLIIQPQLFGALAALSWIQCLYYGSRKSLSTCIVIYVVYIAIFVGIETGATFGIRHYRHVDRSDGDSVLRFFGVFSAVLVSVGLIPQYIEIYKLREVIGISLIFLSIDISGGIFSLLSLVFKKNFDVTASVTYICVIVLDGVVVVCAFILNPRARRRKEREAESTGHGQMTLESTEPSIEPQATLSSTVDSSAMGPALTMRGGGGGGGDLEKGVEESRHDSTERVVQVEEDDVSGRREPGVSEARHAGVHHDTTSRPIRDSPSESDVG